MEVLLLTIFLSLVLAAGFVACFVNAAQRTAQRSLDQQSLMPLDDSEFLADREELS